MYCPGQDDPHGQRRKMQIWGSVQRSSLTCLSIPLFQILTQCKSVRVECKCNLKAIIQRCCGQMAFTKPTALMNSSRPRQTCLCPHWSARAPDHIAYLLFQVLALNVTRTLSGVERCFIAPQSARTDEIKKFRRLHPAKSDWIIGGEEKKSRENTRVLAGIASFELKMTFAGA